MNTPVTPKMFHSFVASVKAILVQANVPIASADNFYLPGTWAYVLSGWEHDVQNRLCALVYCEKGEDPDQAPNMDAPPEYKAILERAGYVVKASRVPGGLDGGWAVWAVYPPPAATEP